MTSKDVEKPGKVHLLTRKMFDAGLFVSEHTFYKCLTEEETNTFHRELEEDGFLARVCGGRWRPQLGMIYALEVQDGGLVLRGSVFYRLRV